MKINFEFLMNCLSNIPDQERHRWRSGECAEFAIGLAELLSEKGICKEKDLSVAVGARHFYDPDLECDQTVFSHAVLCVSSRDDEIHLDYAGLDAIAVWENDFINEDANNTFDWEYICFKNRQGISDVIFGIDQSQPMQEDLIVFARAKIEEFCEAFFESPYLQTRKKSPLIFLTKPPHG